jgi:hypothetical protein
MRKPLLALACLLFQVGTTLAAEVTFLMYDSAKKELTVKDGDAERTYKLTDKTKITAVGKNGTTKALELKVLEKATEGKTKFEVVLDKETVAEIKFKKKN